VNPTIEKQSNLKAQKHWAEPIPEILAPAGGRAQFFAALHSGADAVYLGLQSFNARARADNFSIADLRELLPLARQYGMKVLVTFNILIKDSELSAAIKTLAELEELGVDAIIVQDLTVARLVREYFPRLRLHASTQMAVHNLQGVQQAVAYGFKRVVLAREMTATELRQIRQVMGRDQVELETFCHGSLCYSYSGLCFFSGAEDARSGNRGECAYTCRQSYKIVSEAGEGHLFSMRDLDTSAFLDKFISAGVDCLKIEGRKKDAQYVSTVVRVYREKLDELVGRNTLRPIARSLVEQHFENNNWDRVVADHAVSFQRRPTSLFLNSRYHENVIDLDNASHLGLPIGKVKKVDNQAVTFTTSSPLTKFDGIRVGEQEFSLRTMFVLNRSVTSAAADTMVTIDMPANASFAQVGQTIYKTRSNELKQRIEKISSAPTDHHLKSLKVLRLHLSVTIDDQSLQLTLKAGSRVNRLISEHRYAIPKIPANKPSSFASDCKDVFGIFGDAGYIAEIHLEQPSTWSQWFVPKSLLKNIKQDFKTRLLDGDEPSLTDKIAQITAKVLAPTARLLPAIPEFAIKIDRVDYLPAIIALKKQHTAISEIIFEPKRAFLPDSKPQQWLSEMHALASAAGLPIRIALPTVLRAWDIPLLEVWLKAAKALNIHRFEVGNIGAFKILQQLGFDLEQVDLSSDFTLYALNREASRHWQTQGIRTAALSIEDDATNLTSHLENWPDAAMQPQVILYKDTPLFIAEACTLTALHKGCPTAKVCGYRSLEIENAEGERFHVAHESCKSIVYGQRAFSWTHRLHDFRKLGVSRFRIDFVTRPYTEASITDIILKALHGQNVANTHEANFARTLL